MALRQTTSRIVSTLLRRGFTVPLSVLTSDRSLASAPVNLSEFIDKEIEAETQSRSPSTDLSNIGGFSVEYSGALVKLSKSSNDRLIEVKFSVSASIDSEMDEDRVDDQEIEIRSRPEFTIDATNLKANSDEKVLSFLCSFVTDEDGNESFQIDEFAIHSGKDDPQQRAFSVDCSVLDGELYDHLLEYIDSEFGINNEFAKDAVMLATTYEHRCYIDILRKLKGFVRK